jgi:hypothetical protein
LVTKNYEWGRFADRNGRPDRRLGLLFTPGAHLNHSGYNRRIWEKISIFWKQSEVSRGNAYAGMGEEGAPGDRAKATWPGRWGRGRFAKR